MPYSRINPAPPAASTRARARASSIVCAAIALALVPSAKHSPAGDERAPGPVPTRLAQLVAEARRDAGLRPLAQRESLDRAAADRAVELAARGDDGALASDRPLDRFLAAAGVGPVRNAIEHVVLESGHRDPAALAFHALERKRAAHAVVLGDAADAFGVGEAATPSGSRILVLLVTEDLPATEELRSISAGLLRRINELRGAADARPLSASPRLDAIATAHSEDMARRGYFAHVSPDGGDLASRADAGGFRYATIRENLFVLEGTGDVAELAAGHWMGSRGHRRNLLAPDVTLSGIGLAIGARGEIYVTQLYGSPLVTEANGREGD